MSPPAAPFKADCPPIFACGVRPSPGAASSDPPSALESSERPLLADVAAPEDGRTPPQYPPAMASKRYASAALTICALLATLAALVLFCFDPRQYHFYPICLFHQTTGLLCPGCGALRATHQLLHGHLAAAFRFNPVLIASLPFLFWYCARFALQKARNQPLSIGLRPGWLWLILTAVLVVSVLRNLPGAPFALLRP
jgi:Protein of unknown function (DUF2752)